VRKTDSEREVLEVLLK